MDDEQIIDLYWDRDERAIEETDRKYGLYLTAIARNVLEDPEDSRESVNDTYYAAWKTIPPQRPNILSAYLGKLARRISIDHFRQRTRLKRGGGVYVASLSELEGTFFTGNSIEDTIDMKILGQTINTFLQAQNPQARTAFIGRYFFMDSMADVARYCGMSESKAKSMLHRTRKKLKVYLEKEGFAV